jgi:hypothetical protein
MIAPMLAPPRKGIILSDGGVRGFARIGAPGS